MIHRITVDSDKADDMIAKLGRDEGSRTSFSSFNRLCNSVFTKLKEKYGKGRERQTEYVFLMISNNKRK
jgi:topoisomerase-4 subunit A